MSEIISSVLTAEDARRLTDRIKIAAEGTWQLLLDAWHGRADIALGYPGWDNYCGKEFSHLRLRFPREERQEAVASLRAEGLSSRAIGAALGIDQKTVLNDLSSEENSSDAESDEPERKVTGLDGRQRPAVRPAPPPPAQAAEEEEPVPGDDDLFADDDEIVLPEPKTSGPGAARKISQSISYQWYTPAKYAEAARRVMGGIDLDPASSEEANNVIRAAEFFTEEDDGLAQDWHGRVWLNPPYGDLGPLFVERLIEEFTGGYVTEAIVLVNSHGMPARWFRPLMDHVLCLHYGRLRFDDGIGNQTGSTGPTHGNVFAYLGSSPARFRDEFSEFGWIHATWRE